MKIIIICYFLSHSTTDCRLRIRSSLAENVLWYLFVHCPYTLAHVAVVVICLFYGSIIPQLEFVLTYVFSKTLSVVATSENGGYSRNVVYRAGFQQIWDIKPIFTTIVKTQTEAASPSRSWISLESLISCQTGVDSDNSTCRNLERRLRLSLTNKTMKIIINYRVSGTCFLSQPKSSSIMEYRVHVSYPGRMCLNRVNLRGLTYYSSMLSRLDQTLSRILRLYGQKKTLSLLDILLGWAWLMVKPPQTTLLVDSSTMVSTLRVPAWDPVAVP